MSARSNQRSEDQFLCSICLDVFTDPVTTPCGHNFCKNCITQHWDVNVVFKCPLCKETFSLRPQMKVNTLLREMVIKFKHEAQQKASSSSSGKKAELGKTDAEIQQMIQKRQQKIQELKESVKISNDAADRETAEGVQVFTALMEAAQRGLEELIEKIQDKQKTAEKQAEGFIKDLEQEISELMKRSSEVEQLSRSEDHLHLLQSFSSLKAAPLTKDWTDVRVCPPSYGGTVERAVDQLEETIRKERNRLAQAELKKVQQYAVDVTLNPDTAQPLLVLSDDGKQVHCGDVEKKLPDNPERFSKSVCVLGSQSFSSGRFYFEVQVKGKTWWNVGVARESVARKGLITHRPQNGFWTVGLIFGNNYRAFADPPVLLHLQPGPEKVGVFVDYEEGLVSFYDVDAAALIYSFTGCCFTQKLYPFFCPSLHGGGNNLSPLIICPVNQIVSMFFLK